MRILYTSRVLREAKEEPIVVDTFTHDSQEYDLSKAKGFVEDKEVKNIPMEELDWLLDDIETEAKRIKTADLDNPVIVVKWKSKWVVVDGAHRLTKAAREGLKELPAKVLSQADLEACKIK